MPLHELYDDDSFHEAAPRQSMLPDLPDDVDNATIQSLEHGRRALSEDPRRRFSTRLSAFGGLDEIGEGEPSEFEIDGAFINRRPRLDEDALLLGDDDIGGDDNTFELRTLLQRRQSRLSELGFGDLEDDDEEPDDPTFRFTIQPRLREASPPVVEDNGAGDVGQDEDGEYDEEGEDIVFPDQGDADMEVDEEQPGYETPLVEESDDEVVEADLQAYREETAASINRTLLQVPEPAATKKGGRRRRELRTSKHGTEYPEFPSAVVKRLANGFAKSQGVGAKISKETLGAIMQATDWFFEQAGEDLASYAQHAKRKTIDDSDVIALMKRYVTYLYIYTTVQCR
jgi:histone H3/H4